MAVRRQDRSSSPPCVPTLVWGIRRSVVHFVLPVRSTTRHVDAVYRTLRIDAEGEIHLPWDNHGKPHHRTLQETCNLHQTLCVVANCVLALLPRGRRDVLRPISKNLRSLIKSVPSFIAGISSMEPDELNEAIRYDLVVLWNVPIVE